MAAPTPASGNRRVMMMAAIGGGLLLLAFVASQLLGGGGGSSPSPVTLPPSNLPHVTTTTTAPGSPDVETFEVFTTKNPFTPLSGGTAAGAGSSVGTTTGSTSGSSTGTSSGPVSGGAGSTSTGTSTGTASGGSSEPARGQRVTLLDIFVSSGKTMANVRVDDTVYKVAEGQAFASRYRVISLSVAEDCGRFLFGDDQFRLCKGEQVLK